MKAMILAAGKGTRVYPLTDRIPKPMIPILNKPVMEHIVDVLHLHGFTEIVVTISHLAEQFEDYFRDGSRFGVEMFFVWERELLGSAGALKQIRDFFDDTFVVVCGDAIVDVNLSEVLRFHRERKSQATIVLKEIPRNMVSQYGVVVTENDGRITNFQEKPKEEEALSNKINTGIYLFEPTVLDYVGNSIPQDIGKNLFPTLVENHVPFYGISTDFNWHDIGSIKDYYDVSMECLKGNIKNVNNPGHEIRKGELWTGLRTNIAPDVQIQGPVVIGSNCIIEKGTQLKGPIYISDNVTIQSGSEIEESIIFKHTVVGGGKVCGSILDRNWYYKVTDNVFIMLDPDEQFILGDSRINSEGQLSELQKELKDFMKKV